MTCNFYLREQVPDIRATTTRMGSLNLQATDETIMAGSVLTIGARFLASQDRAPEVLALSTPAFFSRGASAADASAADFAGARQSVPMLAPSSALLSGPSATEQPIDYEHLVIVFSAVNHFYLDSYSKSLSVRVQRA